MAELSITANVSPADRAAIVADLVAALRPIIIEARAPSPALVGRRFVDIRGMAEIALSSESTIARLTASGVIPSIKIGSSRRYDPDAVLDALASASSTSSSDTVSGEVAQ